MCLPTLLQTNVLHQEHFHSSLDVQERKNIVSKNDRPGDTRAFQTHAALHAHDKSSCDPLA